MIKSSPIYATGYVKPKTTSLFYDNIIRIDLDRWFDDSLDIEDDIPSFLPFLHTVPVYDRFHFFGVDPEAKQLSGNELRNYLTNMVLNKTLYLEHVVPVYAPQHYKERTDAYINAFVIDNFPGIVESSLTWKQVIEIRKDKQSANKIKKLKSWMSNLYGTKSEIEDQIERALDEYKDAIRKHGIRTCKDAITILFGGSSALVGTMPDLQRTILSCGLLLSGGVIAYMIERNIYIKEKSNAPIAFLYDALEKVKRASN